MQREQIRELMDAELAKHAQWNEMYQSDRDTSLRRLERGCFNTTCVSCERDGILCSWVSPKFTARYSAAAYRIIANLGCADLVERICTNEIAQLDDVAKMSSYELDPRGTQKERDEIELRRQQRVDQKVSKSFQCRRCGHNETTIKSYQARAADEDSALSIKCLRCQHVWRC